MPAELILPVRPDSPIILPYEMQEDAIFIGNEIAKYTQVADMSDPRQTRALNLLLEMTKDKKRKVSRKPMAVHPLRVASLIAESFPKATNMQIAGLLHDGPEDKWIMIDESTSLSTPITIYDIERDFGEDVGYLVESVTADEQTKYEYELFKSTGEKDLGYRLRKDAALNKAINGGKNPTEIKLADLTDNGEAIIEDYNIYTQRGKSGMDSFTPFNASPIEIVDRYIKAARTISGISIQSGTQYARLPRYIDTVSSLLDILPKDQFPKNLYSWQNQIQEISQELELQVI